MQRLWFILIFLLLSASIRGAPPIRLPVPAVDVLAVPLDTLDPQVDRAGPLVFAGAWEWRSGGHLVGLSSMRSLGRDTLLVSDLGLVARVSIAPGGAVTVRSFDYLDRQQTNEPVEKFQRDAESLAVNARDGATGQYWVGFEHTNQIRRYDLATGKPTGVVAPPDMAHWPANGGAETLLRLHDGRFLVLAEEARGKAPGARVGLLFAGDPVAAKAARPVTFDYLPPEGYVPTDAAELPDGRVLVLNRQFTLGEGMTAVITVGDPRAIAPGKPWRPAIVAPLAPPLTVDNMEGIMITSERDGRFLWLVSDDNQNPLQRTLLLRFRLPDDLSVLGRDVADRRP